MELVALAAVLAASTAFALWRRRTDGRLRPVGPVEQATGTAGAPDGSTDPATHLDADDLGGPLGGRATLVHFSTAFCAPCRATRRVLEDVAQVVPGVVHVEVDAESRLDLVRRLDVRRTPTTFVLDGSGRVVRRAGGAPRKEDVLAALTEAVGT